VLSPVSLIKSVPVPFEVVVDTLNDLDNPLLLSRFALISLELITIRVSPMLMTLIRLLICQELCCPMHLYFKKGFSKAEQMLTPESTAFT
jgi:hypothetical protein